jgi:small-conductance mechanosensitive channel
MLEIMDKVYYGNSVRAWLTAVGIAAVSWLALFVIRWIFVKRLSKIAERTKATLDDLIIEIVRNTKGWFLLVVSLYLGSLTLSFSQRTTEIISTITVILSLLQGAVWSNTLLVYLLSSGAKEQEGERATAISALGFLGKLIVWGTFLLLVLDNIPGVHVGSLIAGFGVAGVAVALAVQNILGDLFAALSIVLDKPFVIGDFIVVDDYSGTVEKIGLKSTRVRSLSGEQLIFSNTDLLSSRIRNFKRMKERRVVFTIGVTYETPSEKLKQIPEIVKGVIESQDGVRFDRAHFKSLGDFSLDYEIVYYISNPDYNVFMDTQQNINLALVDRFAKEGIEFAYPTQTIFLAKN